MLLVTTINFLFSQKFLIVIVIPFLEATFFFHFDCDYSFENGDDEACLEIWLIC